MNKQAEKFIKQIQDLESSGRFTIGVVSHSYNPSCPTPIGEETLRYDESYFMVRMYISRNSTEESVATDIANARIMIDRAEKEYQHSLNNPDCIKSLINYLSLSK